MFKAKCIEGGNWVYGDLIHHPYGICIGSVDKDGLHELYVNEETICQYTGLTDKNGKKIWENDILTFEEVYENVGYDCIGAVYYDKTKAMFRIPTTNRKTYTTSIDFHTSIPGFKKVGNIFDNSELIKNDI